MFEVVLFEPEIPPNTGNVIRLCVNVGARLHLVEPLGFDISDRALRRAGLDYAERMSLNVHPNFEALKTALPTARIWAFTTHAKRMLPEANLAIFCCSGRNRAACHPRFGRACRKNSGYAFPCGRTVAVLIFPTRWRWRFMKACASTSTRVWRKPLAQGLPPIWAVTVRRAKSSRLSVPWVAVTVTV